MGLSQLHRDLAREAVRKSLVLLKNGKDSRSPFLPLDRGVKKILVAGTHADNLGYQCGGWTVTWYGLSGRVTIGMYFFDNVLFLLSSVVFICNTTPASLFHSSYCFACLLSVLRRLSHYMQIISNINDLSMIHINYFRKATQ